MNPAIDSVFLAADDLDAACRPYQRLGLKLSPPLDGCRMLFVGGSTNLFAVHFLAATAAPLAQTIREAGARPLFAVGLGVADFDGTLAELAASGVPVARLGGDANQAWLPLHDRAGTDLVLVRHDRPMADRHAVAARSSRLGHSLPLKRLDHLATVAHDLEAKTRFWTDVLGVGVAGEVVTPAMVIRQLRMGDAVLELLGPASPNSPIWKRPPGLVSMASWEVAGLDDSVSHARTAGFSVTEPAAGPLPGTRIATVQGADLAGVNVQLLEYV